MTRRLFVSLFALLLSVFVALGGASQLDAASPPPPCPSGDTFIFCVWECPVMGTLEDACLALAYHPPNCRVVQPFCFDIASYTCDGGPYPGGRHIQLWCPFESTL